MNMKMIVCGYDGSEHAMKAAVMAAEMAKKFEARLGLLYVVEPYAPPVDLPGISFVDWIEPHRKAALRMIADAATSIAERTGVTPETEVRVGGAANELTHFSQEKQADLVVVGSRGLGAVKRMLLGSVAGRVVHQSAAPVLVVH
ncbi:MAG: universal stress protein [Myxococcaceae bacterium]